jgi:hypothetical protein
MKRIDNRWTKPFPLPFSGTYYDLYPALSPDGNLLFFSSDRPLVPGGKRLLRGRVQLWFSEKKNGKWTEPRRVDEAINSGRRISAHSLSLAGTFHFTRDTPRPHGIYKAKLTDKTFSQISVMTVLNSQSPDHSPYIDPEERYIILSSFRGGLGLSDLFISFKKEAGIWSVPVNMGPKINSSAKDEYPFVSPDGKYFFFNSNRVSSLNRKKIPDGPGNIYWVKIGSRFRDQK